MKLNCAPTMHTYRETHTHRVIKDLIHVLIIIVLDLFR